MSWKRPNIGSRVNREVHARFWERAEVKFLRATRRCCSLIPGLGVKLSTTFLAGPTVLSAVGSCPPHYGVRRRWWINVESAVALSSARQASSDLTTATVPAWTSFPAVSREPCDLLMRYAAAFFVDQLNSVPSTHMRCRMTASLRATATLALRSPLRLASLIPPRL